jgi:alkenylglycerophosphocholine hydrolase
MAGLLFCLAGDIILFFEKYFLLGVIAFLIGHIFYIITFFKMEIHITYPILVVIFVISLIMSVFIILKMDDAVRKTMMVPIIIYVLAISIMVIYALNYDISGKKIFSYLSAGAVLFYISDSIISIDRFVSQFKMSSFLVHLFYYSGQFLILAGILF